MDAGKRRHRVAFDARAATSGDYGDTEGDFAEQFVVWAAVKARLGGEQVMAARLSGVQPVTVTVRHSSQTRRITTDWRARDVATGAIYNIRSIVDPDDGRRDFDLLCDQGVAA